METRRSLKELLTSTTIQNFLLASDSGTFMVIYSDLCDLVWEEEEGRTNERIALPGKPEDRPDTG